MSSVFMCLNLFSKNFTINITFLTYPSKTTIVTLFYLLIHLIIAILTSKNCYIYFLQYHLKVTKFTIINIVMSCMRRANIYKVIVTSIFWKKDVVMMCKNDVKYLFRFTCWKICEKVLVSIGFPKKSSYKGNLDICFYKKNVIMMDITTLKC